MSELPTEPVQRLIGKYEQRISKLEEVNGKLCEEINRQECVIEALTAKQGDGKLTAEQVRETVEKHWHDLPADYDMPEATALPEYSYDWQAIADELNASLGGSECGYEARGFAPFRITAKNADARFGKR